MIVVIQAKVLNFILVIPAIKHNMSSGNIGKRKAKNRKNPPRFRIISEYLSVFSLPAIHATILYPNVFPKINDINEPIKTPIEQYIPPRKGPYIKLPTMQIIAAGIGSIIELKYKRKYLFLL